jgi:hypothetical protein
MPLVSKTFDQLLDFTRTTSATFVGSNGLIQNTPASVNLLTFTQQFDNAVWTKDRVTIAANASTAPDGTNTADSVIATTSSTNQSVYRFLTVPTGTFTLSVFAKANGVNWLKLFKYDAAPGGAAWFNLSAGTVGTVAAGYTAAITAVGNGWYRCSITASYSSGTIYPLMGPVDADNSNALTSTTSGIYVWGAQLELGSTATTYTRNNGGVYPPRFDYDPVTLAPKGIQIEEQRTNLITYSDDLTNVLWVKGDTTVTANATTSPDGTTNADKLVETATNTFHFALQNLPSAVTTIAYTASVYVKAAERTWCVLALGGTAFNSVAWFNLSTGTVGTQTGSPSSVTITDAGNGWWRLTITKTPASVGTANVAINVSTGDGVASYAGDGTSGIFIYGAQLEAGAFPTSYIPTVASQVTRTADNTSIVAPNFAPWYNQSEGTFVVEADSVAPVIAATYAAVSANDNSSNNRNSVFFTSGLWGAITTVGGVNQASIVVSGSYTPNAIAKLSYAYATNNFAFSVNGSAPSTDTSGTVPSVDRLFIGSTLANNQAINGHIRSIRYYPTRLSDAQLQALTA